MLSPDRDCRPHREFLPRIDVDYCRAADRDHHQQFGQGFAKQHNSETICYVCRLPDVLRNIRHASCISNTQRSKSGQSNDQGTRRLGEEFMDLGRINVISFVSQAQWPQETLSNLICRNKEFDWLSSQFTRRFTAKAFGFTFFGFFTCRKQTILSVSESLTPPNPMNCNCNDEREPCLISWIFVQVLNITTTYLIIALQIKFS